MELEKALFEVHPERGLPNLADLRFLARRGLLAVRPSYRTLLSDRKIIVARQEHLAMPVIGFGWDIGEPLSDNKLAEGHLQPLAAYYCCVCFNEESHRRADDYMQELFASVVHELVHWYYLIRYGFAYRHQLASRIDYTKNECLIEEYSQLIVGKFPEDRPLFLRPLTGRRPDLDVVRIGVLRTHYCLLPEGSLSAEARVEALAWQKRHELR
ncbi:MAG TPA: hypothetical protein VLE93_00590 [Candidatus Saccharimonadales bacterium]|nr:hypothetical protein [Candidatus Saccharimonadales bacterium]